MVADAFGNPILRKNYRSRKKKETKKLWFDPGDDGKNGVNVDTMRVDVKFFPRPYREYRSANAVAPHPLVIYLPLYPAVHRLNYSTVKKRKKLFHWSKVLVGVVYSR